jgi:hypothetical protein
MPASARLLQKLRETWGEDVTQDLVTWVSEAQTVNRAELRADLASRMRDQMKWMFVFWIGTLVPLAGLIVALGKNWL